MALHETNKKPVLAILPGINGLVEMALKHLILHDVKRNLRSTVGVKGTCGPIGIVYDITIKPTFAALAVPDQITLIDNKWTATMYNTFYCWYDCAAKKRFSRISSLLERWYKEQGH